MEYLKLTFKDLTPEEKSRLLKMLKELNLPHDMEVWQPADQTEWSKDKKQEYGLLKKAESKIKNQIFKFKNK
jgi:hypothetical protein